MLNFDFLESTLEAAKNFGHRKVANGAELYGLCPHIAPEAWFHKRYKQLGEQEIEELENKINMRLSTDIHSFYAYSNGLNIYSGTLSIYGKRYSFSRKGDDVWQPFCIITANTIERPDNLSDMQYVMGGYNTDGSLLIGNSASREILRKKPNGRKVLTHWPDLITLLKDEIARLSIAFDENGVPKQV